MLLNDIFESNERILVMLKETCMIHRLHGTMLPNTPKAFILVIGFSFFI